MTQNDNHANDAAQHSPEQGAGHSAEHLAEPESPRWLPAVGAVFFLLVGLAWMLCPAAHGSASDAPAASAAP